MNQWETPKNKQVVSVSPCLALRSHKSGGLESSQVSCNHTSRGWCWFSGSFPHHHVTWASLGSLTAWWLGSKIECPQRERERECVGQVEAILFLLTQLQNEWNNIHSIHQSTHKVQSSFNRKRNKFFLLVGSGQFLEELAGLSNLAFVSLENMVCHRSRGSRDGYVQEDISGL